MSIAHTENHERDEKREKVVEEEIVFSYSSIVYFWPVIVLGMLMYWLHMLYPMPKFYGSLWWITLIIPVIAMGVDIPRVAAIAIIASFVILGLLYAVLTRIAGMSFDWLWSFIGNRIPEFSPYTALWTSLIGAVVLLITIGLNRLENRWVINPNVLQRTRWAKRVRMIRTGHWLFDRDWPDILELILLCGGGDLVITNATGTQELARIKNIPFLYWRWPRLRELSEEVRVRVERGPLDEDDEGL